MGDRAENREIFGGGRWLPTADGLDVINPYTGEVVGVAARATAAQALEVARAAGQFRSELAAYERADILSRCAELIERAAAEFARSICLESGLAYRDGTKEVSRAVAQLRFAAEEAKRITGEAISTDVTPTAGRRMAVAFREPVGTVLAITPFNRPLNQVVTKVAPAIAAGAGVIVKPSERTPLTATLFVRALLEAGLPERMISLVTGDPITVGETLVTSGMVDMVTFTGSATVGRRIAQRAGMMRTAFELGDSGALIVLEDADLTAAASDAAAGAFATSGQSCRGVKRILVQDTVADDFAALLRAAAERLRVGDPLDPATDIGTLIDERAAQAVDGRVREAVAGGARLLCGGRREGAQYWPTVLDHVDRGCELVREETFGPCAPIVRVADFEDALECVNDSRYGLQAGLFTQRLDYALHAARTLQVGTVVLNGGPQFESPNVPFGGVKDSGLGREGIRYAIQEMTRIKTLVL
ncbi:aldehyde dehydrogenase family protein [Nocardia terpenica]|uniref:Aldehyde dehydrogenase n=1 Tax=Nocardia terpenica TaxID=455432 RepID=A0A291RL91_9NOCA|nr:aldehyde dehydrogenase family protein [Nocardia terpenica]ATL68039.1 aldehyde dehydrogenase [Nocardia terpenica]